MRVDFCVFRRCVAWRGEGDKRDFIKCLREVKEDGIGYQSIFLSLSKAFYEYGEVIRA